MKQTYRAVAVSKALAGVVILSMVLGTQAADAKTHNKAAGYKVLSQAKLQDGKVTDLFLRSDQNGHSYLYVGYEEDTLSVFDVSRNGEPRGLDHLVLAQASQGFHLRPVGARVAVVTTANVTGGELRVLNTGNGAQPEVMKSFANVEAYAIDAGNNILYLAREGKLTVIAFDHPITKEAQIWEESYEAR